MLCTIEASGSPDFSSPALLEQFSGHFAVLCGKRLLGVCPSLDQALQTATEALSDGLIAEGQPILINEIGTSPGVRVVAEPTGNCRWKP